MKKACFIVFATLPLYHEGNDKYTVIKHSRHLRTLLKCKKHSPVLSSFPSCSQIPVVFYHSVIHGLGFFTCYMFREQALNQLASIHLFKKTLSERTANGSCRTEIV